VAVAVVDLLNSTAAIPRPVAAEKPPPQSLGRRIHAHPRNAAQDARHRIVLAVRQHVAGDEPAEAGPAPLLEPAHDAGRKRIRLGDDDRRELLGNRGLARKSTTSVSPDARRKARDAGEKPSARTSSSHPPGRSIVRV
jgi:hypothetical protein